MRNLFGHLCSGVTFQHDEEMKKCRSLRTHSKKGAISDVSPMVTVTDANTKERLADPLLNMVQHFHEPRGSCRPLKRQRTKATDTEGTQDASGRHRLSFIKRSFQGHLNLVQGTKDADRLPCRAQTEPPPLLDGGSTSSDDVAGEFLLRETSQPNTALDVGQCSQSSLETQMSLSDAAFESQSQPRLTEEKGADKSWHRREAYEAVKESGRRWELGHILVSTSDSNWEEELEL